MIRSIVAVVVSTRRDLVREHAHVGHLQPVRQVDEALALVELRRPLLRLRLVEPRRRPQVRDRAGRAPPRSLRLCSSRAPDELRHAWSGPSRPESRAARPPRSPAPPPGPGSSANPTSGSRASRRRSATAACPTAPRSLLPRPPRETAAASSLPWPPRSQTSTSRDFLEQAEEGALAVGVDPPVDRGDW